MKQAEGAEERRCRRHSLVSLDTETPPAAVGSYRFERDVRILRNHLAQGPHPKETAEQFGERLLIAIHDLVTKKYGRPVTFRRLPVPTGRPPRVDARARIVGRPPDVLARQVAAIVARDGGSLPTVARHIFVDDLRCRDPRRHERLRSACAWHVNDGLSPDRAMIRALSQHLSEKEQSRLDALVRTSRNHLKTRASTTDSFRWVLSRHCARRWGFRLWFLPPQFRHSAPYALPQGIVEGSVSGIAIAAHISLEECQDTVTPIAETDDTVLATIEGELAALVWAEILPRSFRTPHKPSEFDEGCFLASLRS